jgi:hypothetical protein
MLKINSENDKNLILFYLADNSGCSHVRCRFIADYLNANDFGVKAVILPVYTLDPAILAKTRAIIWQKPATYRALSIVQKYKGIQRKFGFKMIYELDDLFFVSPLRGEGLPPYNMSSVRRKENNLDEEIEDALHQIIPLFDTVICSTDYLKKVIIQKYNFDNVVTVKNTVPRFLWSCDKKKPIQEDIKKPVVLYSGASGHYRNPRNKEDKGELGDWDCAFREWVIKSVKEDKIDLKIMGDFPWFFQEISPKIHFIPWTNSYNYPRRCWSTHADFQIAPLAENEFNMSKSALRFYESSIAGMGFFGSVFDTSSDSPYEEIFPDCKIKNSATVEELDEKFWKMCKKENYNELIAWQYDNLNKSGLILESEESVNRLLAVVDRNTSLLETI